MQQGYNRIMNELKQGKYKKLGAGSGRFVYDIGNGLVVKYGRNQKGLAQNQQEHEIFHVRRDPILAAVVDLSADNRFLVMEKADTYCKTIYLCRYFQVSNMGELIKIPEIKRVVYEYQLEASDLTKLSSWGEVRQRPVLIDYGFTSNVRHRYYRGFFENRIF